LKSSRVRHIREDFNRGCGVQNTRAQAVLIKHLNASTL